MKFSITYSQYVTSDSYCGSGLDSQWMDYKQGRSLENYSHRDQERTRKHAYGPDISCSSSKYVGISNPNTLYITEYLGGLKKTRMTMKMPDFPKQSFKT